MMSSGVGKSEKFAPLLAPVDIVRDDNIRIAASVEAFTFAKALVFNGSPELHIEEVVHMLTDRHDYVHWLALCSRGSHMRGISPQRPTIYL